jgi:hypothetical protein
MSDLNQFVGGVERRIHNDGTPRIVHVNPFKDPDETRENEVTTEPALRAWRERQPDGVPITVIRQVNEPPEPDHNPDA